MLTFEVVVEAALTTLIFGVVIWLLNRRIGRMDFLLKWYSLLGYFLGIIIANAVFNF
jgi:hypothetical protein